jgi:hypothetical protein
MSISRIAGLFLAVAVSTLTPGSTTAGWDEGVRWSVPKPENLRFWWSVGSRCRVAPPRRSLFSQGLTFDRITCR